MIEFQVTRIPLPTKIGAAGRADWGWGTSVIWVPGSSIMVSKLPQSSAWCVVDVNTGEIRSAKGMRGWLRAMTFAPAVETDQRCWALTTSGLQRLDIEGMVVGETVRKGIGSYPSVLIDVDDHLMAVGHTLNSTMLLVNRADGAPVKRVRAPGTRVAYPLPNGATRVFGFHFAQACDIDPRSRKVSARHPLPYGRGPVRIGDQIATLMGDRHDHEGYNFWDVLPTHLALVDANTLDVQTLMPSGDAVEVLGADRRGRLVMTNRRGFAVVDPTTAAVVGRFGVDVDVQDAEMVRGDNLVVLLGGIQTQDALQVVRW